MKETGHGESGIAPCLTTQLPYFRQEIQIRQPDVRRAFIKKSCKDDADWQSQFCS
jgi:hypothetical protein